MRSLKQKITMFIGAALAVFISSTGFSLNPMEKSTLISEMTEKTAAQYIVPTQQQLQAANNFFTQFFSSLLTMSDSRQRAAEKLGFTWKRWKQLVLLREPFDNRKGLGAFAVNPAAKRPFFWQAPHRYFDKGTGIIAMHWFEDTEAVILALNNVQRNTLATDKQKADFAHRDESYMMESSLAFAEHYPMGFIVQVHGFDEDEHRINDEGVDIILSQGHAKPSQSVMALRDCLADVVSNVKLYPQDIHELGATTNNIARKLHERGFNGFIHIELSNKLRERLVDEHALRHAFAECFMKAL